MSAIIRLVKEGRMRPALICSYNTWKKVQILYNLKPWRCRVHRQSRPWWFCH